MNPFSDNPITTLTEWNALLASCTCCEMPSCPTPTIEANSRSGDASQSGFPPFVKPAGDDADPLPALYQTDASPNTFTGSGEYAFYEGWFYNAGESLYYETLRDFTYDVTTDINGNEVNSSVLSIDGNTSPNLTTGPVTPIANETIDPAPAQSFYFFGDLVNDYDFSKTETKFTRTITSTWKSGGTKPSLQGAVPGTENLIDAWCDLEEIVTDATEISDPFASSDLRSDAITDAESQAWGAAEQAVSSYALSNWPTIGDPAWGSLTLDEVGFGNAATWPADELSTPTADVVSARFRWEIPDTWEGSWFEILWDIIEEPDGWDSGAPDAPARSFVSQDNSWEWTGPGTPGNAETWRSGWYGIDPPDVAGTRRVVNVRVRCYRGPFGSLPQKVGEQVEL